MRLHFFEFDAVALHLHLVVGASQMVENAVFIPQAKIAGQVPAFAADDAEPICRLFRLAQIPDRQLRARECDLAGMPSATGFCALSKMAISMLS